MRRAGRVVAEMHEVCIRAAKPGATTLDVDARRPRGARAPRRPLELPRLPRVPGGGVHVAQRRHRARHPERRRRARRRRHPLDRLRGDHRGLARRRRGHGPDRRRRRRVAAAHRGHPAVARGRDRAGASRATGSATSAPRSRASPSAAGFTRRAGVRRATASAPPCTRSRRSRTTGRPGRGMKLKEGLVLAIEPMVNAGTAETEVLDDGWTVVTARRPPLRPLRAHHRRHRPRPRGPTLPW